ncbi:MAG: M23 family metallopeptidase [Candidatus Aegiribacteria sp.]
MTSKESVRFVPGIPGTLFVLLLTVLSCGGEPEEGEIVIRRRDIEGEGPAGRGPDTLLSVIEQDSTAVAVDTIPVDTAPDIRPDTLECPWTRLALEINGSIYASLAGRIEGPDVLGAHIVRCMWWDTDPWEGMYAGDSLYVLVGETGRENRVVALRYRPKEGTSRRPFSVYSFRMTGDNFPSHYYSDGTETVKMLSYMPVTTFEEMTGPYGEPRGDHYHAGVDFKAPAGTRVRTCRGGVVTRVNWNHDYNGNCVEVSIGAGYKEVFLHLESIASGVVEGVVLERGDVIGFVGNTGITSTAPHVHYQINDERGNPIDPYLFFGSRRRNLPAEDMERFEAFRDSCDMWLSPAPGMSTR